MEKILADAEIVAVVILTGLFALLLEPLLLYGILQLMNRGLKMAPAGEQAFPVRPVYTSRVAAIRNEPQPSNLKS